MSAPSIFEYLPKYASAFFKKAEVEEIERPGLHAAGTVGLGLLGMAGGTAAGYGAGRLLDKIHGKAKGSPIPVGYLAPAGALLGTGMGLAYSKYKAHEKEELQRALESHRNRTSRSVPGK